MRLVKRALVLLHSSDWRARFGEEYAEVLDRRPLDAFEFADAFRSSARSHARLQSWAPLVLAIGGALCSGFFSIQSNGYPAAALTVMLCSFILTAWKPQHWWLWLSIASLSVPTAYTVANIAHLARTGPTGPFWHVFAALGPAGLATTIAMCIRIAAAIHGCRKRRALKLALSHPE